MKKIIFAILCTMVLVSCTQHEHIIDVSLRVGNILCADGSMISPQDFAASGKTAVGVVFWVNDDEDNRTTNRALAVSLENLAPVMWSDSLANIMGVSTNFTAFDGASNTVAMLLFQTGRIEGAADRAFRYSKNGVSGWFLPSVAQAMEIHANRNRIYAALEAVGGQKFEDIWYWTSTQDNSGGQSAMVNAVTLSFTQGRAIASYKREKFAVRPIIAIQ